MEATEGQDAGQTEDGDRNMDDGAGGGPAGPTPKLPAPPVTQAPPGGPLPYEGVWRFTTAAEDASVPQARHAVRDLLRRQNVPASGDLVHGLLVIVSELVTNAVRHAAVLSPTVGVEVAVGAAWVRVAVEDSHPYRPTALVADHAQTGGRGLLLVREITAEAGGVCDAEHTAAGGKIVWAALPLSPGAGGAPVLPAPGA